MGESSVQAVILAAGKAKRFGRDKLTVGYEGRPLVAHVMGTVAAAIRERILGGGFVVLRPESSDIESLARDAGLTPVANARADAGVSESIRAGLAAAGAAAGAGAVLVLPGDQPNVRLEVISRLVQAWRQGVGPVLRPRYSEEPVAPGHPVLLDKAVWPLVAELAGDTGFAAVFQRRPELVTSLDVSGRNPDVDTPRDLSPSLPSQ